MDKIDNFMLKAYKKFKHFFSKPIRKILTLYFVVFFIGGIFLFLPISHNSGYKDMSFIDALFTSASAFSDTGLSVITTYLSFNFFGQFVLFLLIFFGGLGIFTLRIFFLSFFVKKFSFRSYDLVSSEMEGKNKTEVIKMIKTAFMVSIIFIVFFGFILSLLFYLVPASTPGNASNFNNPEGKFWLSFWMGIFTASSSLNNAGFDITSSASFAVYDANITIQAIILLLFIIGGVGFPLIYELLEWMKTKKDGRSYKFSLISKILFFSYVFVAVGSLVIVYLFEGLATINNNDSFFKTDLLELNVWQRIWALTFTTFSTRSAGFSTFDLSLLSQPTLLIYIITMFIGAGSSSTTGGIRTTTFWILMIFFFSSLKGKKDVETFNRRIKSSRVNQAFIIFTFSLILIGFSSIIMIMDMSFGNNFIKGKSYWSIIPITIFTATSAFGAVGLSVIDTSLFGWVSKLILIFLMFIGQVGIANTLKQFDQQTDKKVTKRLIEEDIVLG